MDHEHRSAILNFIGIDQWVLRDTSLLKTNLDFDVDNASSKIEDCTRCELSKNSPKPLVGLGNLDASLLVISESPVLDKFFKPAANSLFSAMLLAVKIDADSIYITTALKCRVNNKSDHKYSKICRSNLIKQVKQIKPEAILCLGTLAAQTLLDKAEPISILRTIPHEFGDIPVIVSYHPEYLLHKPSKKAEAWQDLLLLGKLL